MKRTVLVTEGSERASLAVVRSLGRAGHRVVVVSTRDRCLAASSRFCSAAAAVPDAVADPVGFRAALAERCREWQVDVVLPVTEGAMLAVLDGGGAPGLDLPPSPVSDLEKFRAVSDKRALMEAARMVGVHVPAESVIQTKDAMADLDPASLEYPVVVKPARSVTGEGKHRIKLSVSHADSGKRLLDCLEGYPAEAYPLLVQRRIVGPGVGVFLLIWDGEVRAAFCHRRLREKPPSGGVSVYRESIGLDPHLLERSVALLKGYDWRGVAMVEYKVEESSGAAYLMEVNGRFWGSLQLAVDAGVDFPALLMDCMEGRMPERLPEYQVGVRSRWLWGDFDHLLIRLRRSAEELALPPGEPSRGRALLRFLLPWRPGDRFEVLRFGDLRPFLRESVEWFGA